MYVYIYIYVQIYMCVCIYINVYTYIHIHGQRDREISYIYMYIHMYICVCIYICICIYTYVCIYMCIRTHQPRNPIKEPCICTCVHKEIFFCLHDFWHVCMIACMYCKYALKLTSTSKTFDQYSIHEPCISAPESPIFSKRALQIRQTALHIRKRAARICKRALHIRQRIYIRGRGHI